MSNTIGFDTQEIDTAAPTRAARLKWVVIVDASLPAGRAVNAAACAAAAHSETFVADMPAAAQRTRVYDEYLAAVGETPAHDIEYAAVSIVGPRNRVDRLVGRLPLLS